MKYNKHILKKDRVTGEVFNETQTLYYQPEGKNMCIPEAPDNTDYALMLEEVAAGTSTIEEVDDTPE
jgi:hypothetical protein